MRSSSSKSNRAANCTARSTRRLSSGNVAGSTARRRRAVEIAAAVERVEVLVVERIPGDRVDREIAAARGVGDRHGRVAGHVEAAVAAAGLRFAARQRDVDVADLVDLKAFADRLDAAERLRAASEGDRRQGRRPRCRCPCESRAEQPVADPAADDQRAAAGLRGPLGRSRCARSQTWVIRWSSAARRHG